jgi:Zn-dependent protease
VTAPANDTRGIRVQIDAGALVVLAIVLAYLATRYFPVLLPGRDGRAAWALAAGAVVGFCVTIVVHEVAHLVVARAFGVRGRRITLELRGGRAELEGRAPTARGDALIAIAGPAANMLLAATIALAGRVVPDGLAPVAVLAGFLVALNLVLAFINLLPILPLDGGRIVRALLWARGGSYERATERAWRWTRVGLVLAAFAGVVVGLAGRFDVAGALLVGSAYLALRGRSGRAARSGVRLTSEP